MHRYFLHLVAAFGMLWLAACSSEPEEKIPDISHIPAVEVTVHRLDQTLFKAKTAGEINQYLEEYPVFAEKYLKASRYSNREILVNQLLKFNTDRYTDTLHLDVERVFGNFAAIRQEMNNAFRFMKYYFPDFQVPEVYTVVSGFGAFGFGADLFLAENMVVVGLDYFAGRQSTYRPPDVPYYILRRYEPEYITPNMLIFLSSVFNAYNNQDRSLIAEMIYYGKAYAFTKKMMPSAPDSLIIGYTQNELLTCESFQDLIWAHFVEENLFYETSASAKHLYVGERPFVSEIADQCPGRVGRWLGWQIVRKFMNTKPDWPFSQVMEQADAKQLFQESKYKPVVPKG
jgi:gliding motility-associated lipoprotein GldB